MLCLLLPLLAIPDWNSIGSTLDATAARRGLKPTYRNQVPGAASCEYAYKRSSDGVTLLILVAQEDSQARLDHLKRFFENGAGGKNPQSFPSNVPLGDFCVVVNEKRSIRTVGEGFVVDAKISPSPQRLEVDKDLRLLEAMSRGAMAEAIGSTFRPDGTPLPRQNPSFERTRDQYGVLSKLLEKHRLKAKLNEWGDRYTITANGRTVEFALGSDTAYLDGKELKLGAFVALRNKAWLLPTAPILTSLRIKTQS